MLVVDDTQGLIIAAVAERMGGYGTILGIHDGENDNYDIVRYMNFSKRILDTIHTVPLYKVDRNEPDGRYFFVTMDWLMEYLTKNEYTRCFPGEVRRGNSGHVRG